MKRLIEIPEELDDYIVSLSKKMGYPITQVIRQILWQYFETKKEI